MKSTHAMPMILLVLLTIFGYAANAGERFECQPAGSAWTIETASHEYFECKGPIHRFGGWLDDKAPVSGYIAKVTEFPKDGPPNERFVEITIGPNDYNKGPASSIAAESRVKMQVLKTDSGNYMDYLNTHKDWPQILEFALVITDECINLGPLDDHACIYPAPKKIGVAPGASIKDRYWDQ
jgi:hypothetical protein